MVFNETSQTVRNYVYNNQESLNQSSPKLPTVKTIENEELKKYFAFNESGNVMIASTSKNILETQTQLIQTFQKCTILFGAISQELTDRGESLKDYSSLKTLISQSKNFSQIKDESRVFKSKEKNFQLSTEIIRQIFGPLSNSLNSLRIVKNLIASLGNDLKIAQKNSQNEREIGHLLFICEDVMGIPIVSLSLFRIKVSEATDLKSINCSSKITKEVSFRYNQETYFYNDQELINSYTKGFKLSKDFNNLKSSYRKYY